ncbi:MAG TPA: hypothetical protein VGD36_13130 [Xanthobacteraceae bacterium]|jgi:hypothetical protein
MARFPKTIGALMAIAALGATLTTAEAGGGSGGWGGGGGGWGGGGKKWGGGYGKGYGYGVPLAIGAGGLALGAVAAGAAGAYDDECYVRRQRFVDEDGNTFVRRVRVCE